MLCIMVEMERTQKNIIQKDLDEKMVFLTGPRQVGKTTLAKSLKSHWNNLSYINYDLSEDKTIFVRKEWNRKSELVIMDEVHKFKKWKTLLKGIYDKEGIPPRLLITGSARLDIYRRGGDSLAGRYFMHRLYPLSVAELKDHVKPEESLKQLMTLGGFPEPFLSQSEKKAKRWRKQYFDRVSREDIRDMEQLKNIDSLLLLLDILRERVGLAISYSSLAEDIQVSPHTIKNWINILEKLYIIFKLTPYHRNIARSILKEPKIYFYDVGMVRGDQGVVFENLVAVSLLKHFHFLEDTEGINLSFHYVRDKEKREVDFLAAVDGKVTHLIEAKLSDTSLHPPLAYFSKKFPSTEAVQIVCNTKETKTVHGIQIEPASRWLSSLAM